MSQRAQVGAILVLALALRLATALTLPLPLSGDASGYDAFGAIFANTGRLDDVTGEPLTYRPPGYPFFVGAIYAVAGQRPVAVTVVQAIIDALTVGLVYWFAARRHSHRVGVAAALLWALSMSAIFTTGSLLSESLGADLAFCCAALTIIAAERRSWTAVIAAGVLCGLLTLLRSMMVLFPAALVVSLLFAVQHPWRLRLGLGAVLSLAYVLTLTPWLARNAAVLGAPKLSTNGGDTLYASWVHPPGHPWGNNVRDAVTTEAFTRSPLEADRYLTQKAVEHIRGDVAGALKLVPQKLILLVAPWDHEVVGRGRSRSWNLHWPLLALLALLAFRDRTIRLSVPGVIGWAGFGVIVVMSVAFYGCARYRAPFEGLLVVPAALVLERLWTRWRGSSQGLNGPPVTSTSP